MSEHYSFVLRLFYARFVLQTLFGVNLEYLTDCWWEKRHSGPVLSTGQLFSSITYILPFFHYGTPKCCLSCQLVSHPGIDQMQKPEHPLEKNRVGLRIILL